MNIPPINTLHQVDTCRLILSKYSENGDSVLTPLAESNQQLSAIFELDHATNDRLMAENNQLPGINTFELVTGFPHYRIVNAAFCHAKPEGSRFNGPDRGVWYASFDIETAQEERIFHKTLELAEINIFEDEVTYDNYLADFHGEFYDIRNEKEFSCYLTPDSYQDSQALAALLLTQDAAGIVYPSVRKKEGENIACFRPALVSNVRKGKTYKFTWSGDPRPHVERV